ncbi:phosphatase PAP2 family protein [Aureitalea marina]|uniref:Phosphatase PAP2 family protein n=1 Tax=Aureitalea marina TaxID=930804 RepID=A0A2S7KMP9_9FLAO|nr:phosphatase PAP2 family protein [Aureitalea marina]PQB03843.1 phosphatase PAP2 family protein [Aureitalea marina]
MIDQLLQYDTDLFLWLNNLGKPAWDGFWLFVTHKFSSIPLYLILLILIYRQLGWKATLVVLVAAALMITASDQLANLFKYGVQRPRPCREEELQPIMRFVAEGCGRFGYYSAHASSSMAAAVFLGLILRRSFSYLPFVLLFWAVSLGYSRIYVGVHYPLDVVSGMAMGGILGFLFYRLQEWGQSRITS